MTQPTYDAIEYVFVDDDGTEPGASLQTPDTPSTQLTGTANRQRIRLQLQNTNAKTGSESFDWEYSKESGSWTPIDNSSSSNIRAIGSAWSSPPTNGEDCSNRLTNQGANFDGTNSGWCDDGAGTSDTFNASEYWEVELCYYIIDADVANGNTIEIRVVENSGDATTMVVTPSITVSKPATASDSGPAYIKGQDTDSDNKAAYIKGQDTDSDSGPAYTEGLGYFPFTDDFSVGSNGDPWRADYWGTSTV